MRGSTIVGILLISLIAKVQSERSFTIGFEENSFLKDGKPFRYISGSLHYFRVPNQYWSDRLLKMKAAGLNTIETYVEWFSHEREIDQYNFEGDLDLVKFIQLAQKLGLYVILRPGPFIDAERDMGGLPYWLLTENKNIVLRTMDPDYITYVDKWFSKLLPMMKPLLYVNGGPIITVQVENEYGSYFACDSAYVSYLSQKLRKELGPEVVLFTTDGDAASYLKCGYTKDAYATVDFGSGVNVTNAFAVMRTKEATGPLVNSEYYPGWLDHWAHPHSLIDKDVVAKTLDEMLAMNANVNIYVFHGGTSFGFTSGSNMNGNDFIVCPTSYDYDAPISEAGDLTPKYFAIQNVIKKYAPIPDIKIDQYEKIKFGPIKLIPVKRTLLDIVRNLSKPVTSPTPLTFEELSHGYGFVLYETKVPLRIPDPEMLTVPGIRDRGYIFVNGVYKTVLGRGEKVFSTPLTIQQNDTLSILVENQGRICYGTYINDTKGIIGDIQLGPMPLLNWTMYPPDVEKLSEVVLKEKTLKSSGTTEPGVFVAKFNLPNGTAPADTFLKLDGWTKGVVWINRFNLGRYWPNVGPQVTLYVPGVYLKPEENFIVILELEEAPCQFNPKGGCMVQFVDTPIINATTPYPN